MGLEDVAAMRALPNMDVIQPCDDVETQRAVEYLADHDGPAFLRLTRQKLDDVNPKDYRFEFGKAVTLREGSGVALIGTGATVHEALKAADELENEGVSVCVINVHTLKPLDAETLVKAARECRAVITVEDHNVHGGLGSAVAEALAAAGTNGTRLTVLGVRDYGQSGSPEELYEEYGISASHVAKAAREALGG
jgi:transketolase